MRLVSIGILGVAALVLGGLYLAFFHQRPAHLATLVPEDFRFGLFYRSLNDLQELYEGPGQRRDGSPARSRVGERINAPGFNGVAYDEPVGSYWTAAGEEVFLVPLDARDAFEDAFATTRERITLKEPHAAASNYVSLSEGGARASRGEEQALVLRALEFPVALCGHPAEAGDLRFMLGTLLAREPARKPAGVSLLAEEVLRMPAAVGAFVAAECRDFLLGVDKPAGPADPLPVVVDASLREGGVLARAAPLVERADLAGLMACLPFNTVLCAGAVLDADGWKGVGLGAVGSGAFAAGIVEHAHHARRFTLLLAARPLDPADLGRLEEAVGAYLDRMEKALGATIETEVVTDGDATVRTRPVPLPEPSLEPILRSSAREPPPVYLSSATEGGVWFCAVGAQAETVVRHCLGCLRGARELGLQRSAAVATRPEFLRGAHAGLAMVSASGLKALQYPMPMVELASFGTPTAVTAILDLPPKATLHLHLFR